MDPKKMTLIEAFIMGKNAGGEVPACILLEMTGECLGSCTYCYSSSNKGTGNVLSTERVRLLLQEIRQLGIGGIFWQGGDPLLHPDLFELMAYNRELGQRNANIQLNPATVNKKLARQLVEADLDAIGIHIDAIDPAAYAQVHFDASTLDKKIRGYRTLLEAGYPAEKTWACICLTRPSIEVVEQTVDWFLDEMGAGFTNYIPFKNVGFASSQGMGELEPSLADLKRAYHYRAQKLGSEELLKIGSGDSRGCCQNYFVVKDDGDVIPCTFFQDMVVGNIYRESLADVFHRERQLLMFDFEVTGPCGDCESSDLCFGCRANAWLFTGDMRASDPKCWINPQSVEHALAPAGPSSQRSLRSPR